MSSCHAHSCSLAARNSGSYFLGTPARSARTWAWCPSTTPPLLGETHHLDSGYPGQSRRTTLASGSASRVPPFLADGEVVEPFALVGVRSAPRRLLTGTRPTTPRASMGRRRRPAGPGLPFLHLHRFRRRNAVVVLGKPVGLVVFEVDPFNAVAVAAARRDHVHRRHRRLAGPPVDFSLTAPDGRVRQTGRDVAGMQAAEVCAP